MGGPAVPDRFVSARSVSARSGLARSVLAAPVLAASLLFSPTAGAAEGAEGVADWLKTAAANLALVTARSFADITFARTEVSPDSGGVVVSDLLIRLPDFRGNPRGCTISVARAEIALDPLALTGFGDTLVRARNVEGSTSCLPPERGMIAAMAGLDALKVDELVLRTSYDLPSGRLDYAMRLDTPGVAEVAMEGRLDYLGFRATLGMAGTQADSGPPSVKFGPARLSIVDRGAAARLALPFGGADAAGRQAGGFLRAMALPELADAAEGEVTRFLREGGRLVVSFAPGDDAWLDELSRRSPAQIAQVMRPSIGAAPPAAPADAALLEALTQTAPTGDDRLALARALLEGRGMPRNPRRARQLLQAMAGDAPTASGEAEALLARALPKSEQGRAYALALRAGARGQPVRGLLDGLERDLSPRLVANNQDAAFKRWDGETGAAAIEEGDTYAVLEEARLFAEGEERPRHFGRALTLALLAEAGGEIGAGALVRELERRMADEAFDRTEGAARDEATTLWARGLAAAVRERAAAQPAVAYDDAPPPPLPPVSRDGNAVVVVPDVPGRVPPRNEDVIAIPERAVPTVPVTPAD